MSLNHLQTLEAESLHIFRETVAQTERPVLLYSIGKDSSVLLHLARKAFAPAPLPFPLLHIDTGWKFRVHIDTGWKFREMIAFRDATVARHGLDLRVHTNPRGAAEGISPITHGSSIHTDVMKTEALRQAIDAGHFDAAFGGARRDEEASRAKERIISHRTSQHRWDPRLQRPELWQHACNARSYGSSTTCVTRRVNVCAYFRCPTGLNWMSGTTSSRKASMSSVFRCRTPGRCARWHMDHA